jgi:hypothetical protein
MKSYFVPLGRLNDYVHPQPELTGTVQGSGVFSEIKCTIFPSRQFLLNAVKKGGIKPLVRHTITLPGGCAIER